MTLVHPRPGIFTTEHLALFQAIADQAAVAVLNARLFAESQRKASVMSALAESAASINSSLKIDDVLDKILQRTGQVLNVQAISLALIDPASKDLVFQAANGWKQFSPGDARLQPGRNIAGWVAQSGQPVIAADAQHHPRFDPEMIGRTGWAVKAIACAPIKNQNRVIGVLEAINPKEGEFSPDALLLLDGIGSLAGTAIQNAQLFERLQAAHQRLDSLRNDLISMIFHDLQSPLANVVSSLDVVESILQEKEDSTLESLIDIASRSTQRIQRLINSLLDINRLEAGQPLGARQPVSPHRLAEEALDLVQPVAQNHRQEIRISMPAALPPVFIDADMILRVLINLLENAVKYSNNEGDIIVGGRDEKEWITLWVEDHGPGVPEEDKDWIFDKFTRLGNQGAVKGVGLGLAFCRLAVQAHGGKIWVENQTGGGSRFLFTLPASA
jgi:K+-sensing histidine kinase KdpD